MFAPESPCYLAATPGRREENGQQLALQDGTAAEGTPEKRRRVEVEQRLCPHRIAQSRQSYARNIDDQRMLTNREDLAPMCVD